MFLAELWRYPVKSMGGERLTRALLTASGVEGDRAVLVRWPRGRIVTARTRPALLGLHATMGADREPLVDGRPWRDPEIARRVEAAAGAGAKLESAAGNPGRFDVLPLLVMTDGALNAAGYDWRRFRPNLIISGVEGLAERDWEGRRLRVGHALLAVADLRARCVMTTFDPDTQVQDPGVLRRIVEEFDAVLGLNCGVIEGGAVAEGDPVELV
ncbi:MAG: MOSC domain-containing protein [Deltaproteobacteria bacterium]|nr:MAG: MOSC domain-containing protein [Deltaproteobacteria bacterium]